VDKLTSTNGSIAALKNMIDRQSAAKKEAVMETQKNKSTVREQLQNRYYGYVTDVSESGTYDKPRTKIVRGDGLYVIESNPIGTITTREAEFKIPGHPEDVEPNFELTLPRIPINHFAQIVTFFRKICKEMNEAEAYAVIYFDIEKQEYFIDVPKHVVSKGGVRYERDLTKEADPNLITAMEIHSHNTMSGYFSGTDTADEKAFRLYGVVGKIQKALPEWALRAVSCVTGQEVPLSLDEIFDIESDTVDGLENIPVVEIPEAVWRANIAHVAARKQVVRPRSRFQGRPDSIVNGIPVEFKTKSSFDPSLFGEWGPSRTYYLPKEEDRIQKIRDAFGEQTVDWWEKFGLGKDDRELLYTFGEDPDWVSEYLVGIDPPDQFEEFSWLLADEAAIYDYIDAICNIADQDDIYHIVGRLAAIGHNETINEALRDFHETSETFGE